MVFPRITGGDRMDMDITGILESITILKIHNLMPKRIGDSKKGSKLKDGFLLLARENDKFMTVQNLGYIPDETEINHIKKHISLWGGGDIVEIHNGILKMELPAFMKPFIEKIFDTPGCRISPNLLRIEDDVYLSIEFPDVISEKVEKITKEFLEADYIFEKEMLATGHKTPGVPPLLKIYEQAGHSLKDFVLITTVWEFNDDQKLNQNEGVFTNIGEYVPKGFINGADDLIIYKKAYSEVSGNSAYTEVDKSRNILEFRVKSQFFSDFYNQIIAKYTGPIFMHPIVSESMQKSYYIIGSDRKELFLEGIKKHWSLEARKDHANRVESVESLDKAFASFDRPKQLTDS